MSLDLDPIDTQVRLHQPIKPKPSAPQPHVTSLDSYRIMYQQSVADPELFFGQQALKLLSWSKPFSKVLSGGFQDGDVAWFGDGEINACYNCVDRWFYEKPDAIAIIHDGDELGNVRKVTYKQLFQDVCRLANYFRSRGLKKGDSVAIYMPMVPEAVISMLACARIGVIHSVIFGGFSAESLRDRILDAQCKLLITADQGLRGGKVINLKRIADDAVAQTPSIQGVIVYQHTGDLSVPFFKSKDVWWHEVLSSQRPFCPLERTSSEDILFLLYTSGSTGKPKGLAHTIGGYLLQTALTTKYIFDVHSGDVFGCTADIGWVTGHSYICYGPLSLGATTVMFESIPTYPDAGRYWDLIQRHRLTQFYTAPTAIRALMRFSNEYPHKYDLSSVRVLGSVGEPINPAAWDWYYEHVGKGQTNIVDTYWQTETGGIIIAPLPGATPTKPGSATLPFFGIEVAIIDPQSGKELTGDGAVTGVLCVRKPWPGIARTIYGDHSRYIQTYLSVYPGFYFTGDGATRDADGYYWIRGRVDDVINVSGHRLGTAEIESALVSHPACAEASVIGVHDELTGQAIVAFCLLKEGHDDTPQINQELIAQVRRSIGPIATPKKVYVVPGLPKTRSGKIMRRILRKICAGEMDGTVDTTTLADSNIVELITAKVHPKEI